MRHLPQRIFPHSHSRVPRFLLGQRPRRAASKKQEQRQVIQTTIGTRESGRERKGREGGSREAKEEGGPRAAAWQLADGAQAATDRQTERQRDRDRDRAREGRATTPIGADPISEKKKHEPANGRTGDGVL